MDQKNGMDKNKDIKQIKKNGLEKIVQIKELYKGMKNMAPNNFGMT